MRILVLLGALGAAIAVRRRAARPSDDLWQRATAEADRVRGSHPGP